MSKWKKVYCIASFVFAVCVFVFTITYSFSNSEVMYAAEVENPEADYRDDGADGI